MFHLWARILRLALPSIATFASMTLTGMITLVMIGRLGPGAIAVVGITNILMYNAWALFAGINEAINYLVSQNFGDNNMEQGNERTQIALVLSVVLSFLWLGASFVIPHPIFMGLGVAPGLIGLGATYLKIRMLAFCFSLLTNVLFAYMRGIGDTRTPMFISTVTSVLLIALTSILTYGQLGAPRLGLAGAGWSMVITEGIGLAASAYVYLWRYHDRLRTRVWRHMTRTEWRTITWESVKLSAMELSMSLGMIVFTACIARLGTAAVAANEITLNILSLGFMPANGFSAAATIAVGQDVGAGQPLRAKQHGLHTWILGMIFMALFSVFLWVFAPSVATLYTSDITVISRSIGLIHLASFIQLFDGTGIIVAGGLRGAGDTTFLFRMALILNWAMFVPLTLLLTVVFHTGQTGAWLALCALIVGIGIANLVRYVSMQWAMVQATGISVQQAAQQSV